MKGKTWSDNVCGEMIRMIMPIDGGLEACKVECNKEKSCNAIEYSSNVFNQQVKCCVLRKCPLPVPEPQVKQANYHDGKSKYVGFVKRKYTPPEVLSYEI